MATMIRKEPRPSDNPPRFGAIAVELGYITSDQLKKALIEQVEDDLADRPHRLLGSILYENGWITFRQREEILDRLLEISPTKARTKTSS